MNGYLDCILFVHQGLTVILKLNQMIVGIHELDCHKLHNFGRITTSFCNANRCPIALALS